MRHNTTAQRVQKHRNNLRAAGYRPVQLWVLDTRSEGFAAECTRQGRLVAEADKRDPDLFNDMDAALEDVDGWSA